MWQIRLVSKEIYIMKLKVESVRSEFYSVSYENNNDNAMFYFDLTNYTLIVVSTEEISLASGTITMISRFLSLFVIQTNRSFYLTLLSKTPITK